MLGAVPDLLHLPDHQIVPCNVQDAQRDRPLRQQMVRTAARMPLEQW
jgi:hypothetical protein